MSDSYKGERVKDIVEDRKELREALKAATEILRHPELRAAESIARTHGFKYSRAFQAQIEAAWKKINTAAPTRFGDRELGEKARD